MSLTKQFALHCPRMALRSANGLAALVWVFLTVSSASAQRLPLPPNEQEEVNHAIDRGVAYLKQSEQKNGTWARPRGNWEAARFHGYFYPVAFAALPGLTLLECGVPATDPTVQQAARYVRSKAAKLDRTYELSLALLFLDRLGDPKDKKIIQTFALRLIAGQSATGGWGYRCPLLSSLAQTELLTALHRLDPEEDIPRIAKRDGKKSDELPPFARVPNAPPMYRSIVRPRGPSLSESTSHGSQDDLLTQERTRTGAESRSGQDSLIKSPDRWRDCLGLGILDKTNPVNLEPEPQADQNEPRAKHGGKADNDEPSDSKTAESKSSQPYMIPKRISMLPVVQDPALHVLQDPLLNPNDPFLTTTDNSNTQFAILALWRAQQYEVPMKRSSNLIVRRFVTSQNQDGSWGYHYRFGGNSDPIRLPNAMTCVGLIGLAVGHGLAKPKQPGQVVQDARIVNGLIALSQDIGEPVEHRVRLPMQNLYFLWSLERVAVLYNLPTLGDKDWYRWGAQVLIRNQESKGNWSGGLYIGSCPPLDTCLALLFLKRANLVKDLTAKLPFAADELNNSIMQILGPFPKPTEPPKEKKKPLPIDPPKLEEPKTPSAHKEGPPLPPEINAPESENSSNSNSDSNGVKTKWLVMSAVLFLIFSGGSVFFILLAINRRKEVQGEEEPAKRKKRSVKREPKGSAVGPASRRSKRSSSPPG